MVEQRKYLVNNLLIPWFFIFIFVAILSLFIGAIATLGDYLYAYIKTDSDINTRTDD